MIALDPIAKGALVWFALAGATIVRALLQHKKARGTERIFWPFALVLCGFGYVILTEWGQSMAESVRQVARTEGWYAFRADVQKPVILAAAAATTVLALLGMWSMRRSGLVGMSMVIAIAWTIGFQGIRGISLHDIDYLMTKNVGPMRINQWGQAIGWLLAVMPLALPVRKSKRR